MMGYSLGHDLELIPIDWDALLFLNPNEHLPDLESFLDYKRRVGAVGDDIELFLIDDTEHTFPESDIDRFRSFCPEQIRAEVRGGYGSATQRYGAWLDDRSTSLERPGVRIHPKPLNAHQLWKLLKPIERFDMPGLVDAHRRLIYIENPDPAFYYALAETASYHQVATVREALVAHLNFQTCFQLKFSAANQVYQFCMNLVYPYMPSSKSPEDCPAHLEWIDTSFTRNFVSAQDIPSSFGMYKARTTLAICGSGSDRYSVYCFVDVHADDETLQEKFGPDPDSPTPFSDDEIGIVEDPIASGDEPIDADEPITDVRAYGLLAVNAKLADFKKHWKNVVGNHEFGFGHYRRKIQSSLGSTKSSPEEMRDMHNVTEKWMSLLTDLEYDLRSSIKDLQTFIRRDFGFFSPKECTIPRTWNLKRSIQDTLGDLTRHHDKLESWEKICKQNIQRLQVAIQMDASERGRRSGMTSEWTFKLVTPVALSIGFFSMNETASPLPMNVRAFLLTTGGATGLFQLVFWLCSELQEQGRWTTIFTAPFSQKGGRAVDKPQKPEERPVSVAVSVPAIQLNATAAGQAEAFDIAMGVPQFLSSTAFSSLTMGENEQPLPNGWTARFWRRNRPSSPRDLEMGIIHGSTA